MRTLSHSRAVSLVAIIADVSTEAFKSSMPGQEIPATAPTTTKAVPIASSVESWVRLKVHLTGLASSIKMSKEAVVSKGTPMTFARLLEVLTRPSCRDNLVVLNDGFLLFGVGGKIG